MSCVNFAILSDNFAFKDDIDITASSENTEFPASNMADPFRSAVWRSSGHFEIETGVNDKIDFDEGAGELTATLDSGSYTGATLASEIETKIEAAGVESYSVSYDTSDKTFTLTSDTGATFELPFSTGSSSATSVGDTIGFSSDQTGALTYEGAFRIHNFEYLQFDLQTTEDVDHFVMMFPKGDGIQFTSGVELRLQANATANFSSPAVDVDLSSELDEDFEVLIHKFATTQSYRYWRVKIIDKLNPNGFVEVGKVILDKAVTLTDDKAPDIGFLNAFQDISVHQFTPSGHKHTDIYPVRKVFQFNLGLLQYLDSKTLQNIYKRVGSHERIAVLMDSDEDLFQKEDMFIYGTFSPQFQIQHVFQQRMTLPVSVQEEF